MQNIDTENVHEGHYLPVCEQKQKHKHIVIQRLLCWHLSDKPSIRIILLLQRFPILVFSNMPKGPLKCYVMQMGVGVSDFLEKSVTKV